MFEELVDRCDPALIEGGQEEQPVWWKEDSSEFLETWIADMQVTTEIVKCLYGIKPTDPGVQSLCEIYLANRSWGAWERRLMRDHFTKLGVKVVPALRKAVAVTETSARTKLEKQIAAKQMDVEAANHRHTKAKLQKELWKKATREALEHVQKAGVKIFYPDKTLFSEQVKPIYEDYKNHPELYQLIQEIKAVR